MFETFEAVLYSACNKKDSQVIVEAIAFQPGLWLQVSRDVEDTDLDAIYLETLLITSLTIEIILIVAVV